MSGEKIQVREGWWRQRCGNVVRVVGKSGDDQHPWRCASGGKYRNNGRYFTYGLTEMDLIEFIGQNIAITSTDIDIPELRVPVLFWACPDCPESVITWHRGVATCDGCGKTSAD